VSNAERAAEALPLPEPVRPMLAVPGTVPTAPGWAFEFKWDGVRAIVAAAAGQVRLTSRNGNDVTAGYPEIVQACAAIPGPVLLDGELVALDATGRPDFGLLQQRMHVRAPAAELRERVPVSLYVFDVLQVNAQRLLGEPFDARRERLLGLGLVGLAGVAVPPSFTDVSGPQLLEVARGHRLEGVVAKRRTSRYEPGRRSPAWVKTALLTTREVLLGGWTAGEGRRQNTFGALLLGARDADGRLRYLGNVGTGFTEQMLRDLLARLEPLRRDASPFDEPLPREHTRGVRWVEPRLVGEVQYRTLTADNRLRHAAWRGLRPDRDPEEVLVDLPSGPEPVR
jgi:bifunctional non-homologous end joining protein LigD